MLNCLRKLSASHTFVKYYDDIKRANFFSLFLVSTSVGLLRNFGLPCICLTCYCMIIHKFGNVKAKAFFVLNLKLSLL